MSRKKPGSLTESTCIKDVCSESNKKFWTFIKGLKKDSFGIPSLKNESGILVMENKQKAALLNRQFESVFTDEDLDHMPQINKPNFPPMPEIEINVAGVEKLLSKLKIHKATGPDGVPSRILRECASEIAPAISTIFQFSLSSGILPDSWAMAPSQHISCVQKRRQDKTVKL